jgi:hypothetical protein
MVSILANPKALQALVLQQLSPFDLKDALGTFSSSEAASLKAVDDVSHPVNIYFANETDDDRVFLAASGTVPAFLYSEEGKVMILSNPKGGFDKEGKHVIIGHNGDSLVQVCPVSIPARLFKANTYGFLPSSLLLSVPHLMDAEAVADKIVLVEEVDVTIPSIPTFPDDNVAHFALLPILVPLPFGHGIEGGTPLDSLELQENLILIHPMLAHWRTSMMYVHANYQGSVSNAAGVDDVMLHDIPAGMTFSPSQDPGTATLLAPTSDEGKAVSKELERIQTQNFALWFQFHREEVLQASPFLQQLLTPALPAPVPHPYAPLAPVPVAATLTTADVQASHRATRTKVLWQLFGILKVTDPATGLSTLELPELAPDLVTLVQESSMQHAAQPMLSSIRQYCTKRREESRDVMFRQTDFPMGAMSMTLLGLIRTCQVRTEPISARGGIVDASWSPFNLLIPDIDSPEYLRTEAATKQVILEIQNNEPNTKRTRTTHAVYEGGKQSELGHVTGAYANLDCLLSWAYKHVNPVTFGQPHDLPVFLVKLRQLFDMLTHHGFEQWFATWKTHAPWLAHALLIDLHTIFRTMAAFATNSVNIAAVMEQRPISSDLLALYEGQVEAALSRYTDAMTTTTLVSYHAEPMTYARFGPSKEKMPIQNLAKVTRRDSRDSPMSEGRPSNSHQSNMSRPSSQDRNRANSQSTQRAATTNGPSPLNGCIIIANGVNPGRPPALSDNKVLCYQHMAAGVECNYGMNCQYAHRQYPNIGSFPDRRVFEEWVYHTPGVSWAPGYGPRPSGNRSPPPPPASNRGGGRPSAPANAGNAGASTPAVTFSS